MPKVLLIFSTLHRTFCYYTVYRVPNRIPSAGVLAFFPTGAYAGIGTTYVESEICYEKYHKRRKEKKKKEKKLVLPFIHF